MSTTAGTKRKAREGTDEAMERDPKRTSAGVAASTAPDGPPTEDHAPDAQTTDERPPESEKKKGKRRAAQRDNDAESAPSTSSGVTYRKLAPPRPFPTVPTSVSATGPRSAHVEGKNYICVTRKTPLGAYLRRCKDVILKDG